MPGKCQHKLYRKLVLIEWLDSRGTTSEWEYIEDIEPLLPCICSSVGFLINETDQYKTIAQSLHEDQVMGRMTIPCCSIQKIQEIKVHEKE